MAKSNGSMRTLVDFQSATCWLLVADVEGSTHLGEALTPEQVSMLLGGWFKRCEAIVEAHGGTVNKYLGDGFLAFWKAVSAPAPALARVLTELRRLQELARPRFRFVLHRGEVLLGGGGTLGEDSLSGAAVNFVFRMEKLAGALREACLLSEPASQSLEDAIVLQPGGEHEVPSFEGRHRFFCL